jgi:hypothetical protein
MHDPIKRLPLMDADRSIDARSFFGWVRPSKDCDMPYAWGGCWADQPDEMVVCMVLVMHKASAINGEKFWMVRFWMIHDKLGS